MSDGMGDRLAGVDMDPADVDAWARMGQIALDRLADHEFGRCACSVGAVPCWGKRFVATIGSEIYDRVRRDGAA